MTLTALSHRGAAPGIVPREHRCSAVIGELHLQNPLLLAPLAGITIPPLRLFFSRLGAGAVHTEMISCAGLLALEKQSRRRRKTQPEHEDSDGHFQKISSCSFGEDVSAQRLVEGKTERMLRVLEGESPVIAQFFAGDAETLAEGVEFALKVQPRIDALGINMACPMPKVMKKGSGARLLERPDVAFDMVRRLAVMGFPVWPKIRKCPPSMPLSTEAFCEGLLAAGAATVTVHGRTPAQRYSGDADTGLLHRLAALFPGSICASGDVFSVERAIEYLDGGCAAVMLARGALADPFLFPRTLAFLGYEVHNKYRNPSPDFQLSLLLEFGDSICAESGPRIAVILVKRLLSGLFKGLPGIGELRRSAAHILSWKDLREILATSECFFKSESRRPANASEASKVLPPTLQQGEPCRSLITYRSDVESRRPGNVWEASAVLPSMLQQGEPAGALFAHEPGAERREEHSGCAS